MVWLVSFGYHPVLWNPVAGRLKYEAGFESRAGNKNTQRAKSGESKTKIA